MYDHITNIIFVLENEIKQAYKVPSYKNTLKLIMLAPSNHNFSIFVHLYIYIV